jgi:hypothetical protein
MGGMLFDRSLQKGIKKRYIPPPMIVSFPSNASYKEVIQKGVDKFFPDDADSPDIFCLADSSGVPFDVEDKDTWNLLSTQDYLQANFVYML